MLALNNKEQWADLTDALEDAKEIPAILKKISQDSSPKQSIYDSPWDELWPRISHQSDIYTASYAAVPHIVQIAELTKGPIDKSFFLLPASIEHSRLMGKGPEVPESLKESYFDAIRKLPNIVANHINDDWDRGFSQSVFYALSVAKGFPDLAERIENLDSD